VSDELEFAMSDADLTKALVTLTYGQKKIGMVVARLRKIANKRWTQREVRVAKDAQGRELGSVTRTNPATEWVVDDPAVLMAHLQDENPDALEDYEFIRSGVTDEQVMAACRAAGLTDTEPRVRDYWLNHLLKKSARDKSPAAPGITSIKPTGTTNVYPSKEEEAAIEAVLSSGEVSLLTGEVKQIEGGQQ
jgi:hypothetical protein